MSTGNTCQQRLLAMDDMSGGRSSPYASEDMSDNTEPTWSAMHRGEFPLDCKVAMGYDLWQSEAVGVCVQYSRPETREPILFVSKE